MPHRRAPESHPDALGSILAGRFRLVERLGTGATGTVYRAEHTSLRVPVAVKVLHPLLAVDPEHRRRFSREARAAMMLDHPHVVRVLDLGEDDGRVFIAMELIDGESLDHLFARHHPLPPVELVIDVLTQVADALAAAHARGLVHRDLKPENILVERDLRAKVVDFGLVHMEEAPGDDTTLTRVDMIAGTPAFMSPEQCRSLAVGPSTDLYALGCILTVGLQGAPPFDGASAMDVIAQQMFSPPPPLERPSDAAPIPAELEHLRLRLLAKRPHDRPLGAAAVRDQLQGVLTRRAEPGREMPRFASQRPPRGATATSDPLPVDTPALLAVLVPVAGGTAAHEACRQVLLTLGIRLRLASDLNTLDEPLLILDAGPHVQEAARLVREARARKPDIATLVCVAELDIAGMRLLIESGATDVLRTPGEPEHLARKVRRIVRRQT